MRGCLLFDLVVGCNIKVIIPVIGVINSSLELGVSSESQRMEHLWNPLIVLFSLAFLWCAFVGTRVMELERLIGIFFQDLRGFWGAINVSFLFTSSPWQLYARSYVPNCRLQIEDVGVFYSKSQIIFYTWKPLSSVSYPLFSFESRMMEQLTVAIDAIMKS